MRKVFYAFLGIAAWCVVSFAQTPQPNVSNNVPCAGLTGSSALSLGCTGGTNGQTSLAAQSGVYVICMSKGIVAHTGDSVETTLSLPCSIPGNAMGLNGHLRVTYLSEYTNDATTKMFRVRFGGASFHTIPETATAQLRGQVEIFNVNATNSQSSQAAGQVSFGTSTSPVATGTIDTTQAQSLTITGQLGATTTDNVQLDSYTVELITTAGN